MYSLCPVLSNDKIWQRNEVTFCSLFTIAVDRSETRAPHTKTNNPFSPFSP